MLESYTLLISDQSSQLLDTLLSGIGVCGDENNSYERCYVTVLICSNFIEFTVSTEPMQLMQSVLF